MIPEKELFIFDRRDVEATASSPRPHQGPGVISIASKAKCITLESENGNPESALSAISNGSVDVLSSAYFSRGMNNIPYFFSIHKHQDAIAMGSIRQKSWFPITAYLMSALGVLLVLFIWAETYFPSPSPHLIPNQSAQSSRWNFGRAPRQSIQQDTTTTVITNQNKILMRLNQKLLAGNTELIYRGLVGKSEFRIDVIVPDLDPQTSYHYRFKISEAKKSFRLANRNFKLISAKKGTLRFLQIR